MQKIFIVLLFMASGFATFGGNNPIAPDSTVSRKKVTYYFTFGMGFMAGCQDCKVTGPTTSFSTSMVHGVRYGRASLGAGVGFDAYENWRAVPLFGSASWDLFGKRNTVFVQLNYGYAPASIGKGVYSQGEVKSEGGKMINPLLGYRIQSGNLRVHLTVGYKFQRVFSTYPIYTAYPMYLNSMGYSPDNREVRMDMNRFTMGMAIGWR